MTATQLTAFALLGLFWAYCVLYCLWETRERRAPLIINHGGTMTEPPPDEATPLHDLVARLFDQAEYEAAVHGHEVVAEAERILRGAV